MISNHCLCKYFMMTLGYLPADITKPIEVVAFVYAPDQDHALKMTRAYLTERGRPMSEVKSVVARELGRAGQA